MSILFCSPSNYSFLNKLNVCMMFIGFGKVLNALLYKCRFKLSVFEVKFFIVFAALPHILVKFVSE